MTKQRYHVIEALGESPGENPRKLRREDFKRGSPTYFQRNLQASFDPETGRGGFNFDWKALPRAALVMAVQAGWHLYDLSTWNLPGLLEAENRASQPIGDNSRGNEEKREGMRNPHYI